VKRPAVQVLIISVVVSALLGIWALLKGDFGAFEGKVLATSLSISGASILAMACGAAWTRSPFPLLPRLGLVLALAGFGLLILFVWGEVDVAGPWKTCATLLVFATAAAHASLLSLRRLPPGRGWLLLGAYASGAALATLIVVVMWREIDADWPWRWIGVFSILLCAFTVLVVVFERIARQATSGAPLPEPSADVRYCPFCGAGIEKSESPGSCSACGAGFHVTLR
jgi:hypothetical protein